MEIKVNGLGKKFIQEWIFRDLSAVFRTGSPTAITGPNGSGKSTLLQLLSGQHLATKGEIKYHHNEEPIPVESIYRYLSIAAPYLELIEEFKLDELLSFHFKFKPLNKGLTQEDFKALTHLEKEGQKEVKKFSSGMKQRLKLGLCFFTQSPICLLDEPTSNLDHFGVEWYLNHIEQVAKDRLLIISSNQAHEYNCCDQHIYIPDFK